MHIVKQSEVSGMVTHRLFDFSSSEKRSLKRAVVYSEKASLK